MAPIDIRDRRLIVPRGSWDRPGSSRGRGSSNGRIGSGWRAPSGARSRGPAVREKWLVALRLRPTFPPAGRVAMSDGRREGGQERIRWDGGLRRNDGEVGDDLVIPGRGGPGHEPVGPEQHSHPGIEDEPPGVAERTDQGSGGAADAADLRQEHRTDGHGADRAGRERELETATVASAERDDAIVADEGVDRALMALDVEERERLPSFPACHADPNGPDAGSGD